MNDRDYIAWSLLCAGAFGMVFALFDRFRATPRLALFERRRDQLELELGEQLGLRHNMEAGKVEDSIVRLETFSARHPRLRDALTTLDRANVVVVSVLLAFCAVGIWTDRIGYGGGKWSPIFFYLPSMLISGLIEMIPPTGNQLRGALVVIALAGAFFGPLTIAGWWAPR